VAMFESARPDIKRDEGSSGEAREGVQRRVCRAGLLDFDCRVWEYRPGRRIAVRRRLAVRRRPAAGSLAQTLRCATTRISAAVSTRIPSQRKHSKW
jgi:hypothetical protein